MKTPFVTKDQLESIAAQYPTPFHIYDERGIRENARRLRAAFAWNPGFREYFAVKATPTPAILKILREEGCGTDCSSLTELMLSDKCGFSGQEIMFSSNETPAAEYELAAKLGAVINLDDFTHIDFLKETLGYIPETISCRFNPGGVFRLGESKEGFQVMDTPGDSKYGFTREQLFEGFKKLKRMGAKRNWRKRPAVTSPSSTSPGAWAFPTARTSRPTTSPPSARGSGGSSSGCWSLRGWGTWPSIPSWAVICWVPTDALSPRSSTSSILIRSMWGWMPAPPT